MKRLLALAAATATAATVTLSVSPAHANVGTANVPTAAQVSKVMGKKMTRTTIRTLKVATYKGCKESRPVTVRNGILATYAAARPTFAPGVNVVQAKGVAQAKFLMKRFIKASRTCTAIKSELGSVPLVRLKAPALGQQSAAFRITHDLVTIDHVMVRKGSRLVGVSIVWAGKPKTAKVMTLARIAVKKA